METITIPGLPNLNFGNIFCIGRNYVEHARELQHAVPDQPLVFLKPTSSLIFNGDAIHIPPRSTNVHHEVDLVVAIGEEAQNISEEQALAYIAGYAVGIDVTARDIQQKAKENGRPWTVAKGFDTFAPLSKFVAAKEVPDPQNIDLKLWVNNKVRQSDNTKLMIFPIRQLISYLSHIFTLKPGDLIFTGTPKGVSHITSGDNIKASMSNDECKLSVTVK